MKKVLKKISTIIVVIGVVLMTTPFMFIVNGATANYYFLGKYEKTLITSSTGINYDFEIYNYIDYDNNCYKIDFYILSTDEFLTDYSDLGLSITRYRTTDPYSQFVEHQLCLPNYSDDITGMCNITINDSLTNMIELTCIIPCDATSFYQIEEIYYFNYENDNDIEFAGDNFIFLGYAPEYYENIIEGYKTKYYQFGQTETITNINPSNYLSQIGTGINNIFSIELFGGITIGTLVFIPIAMSVLLLLLHVWRRN